MLYIPLPVPLKIHVIMVYNIYKLYIKQLRRQFCDLFQICLLGNVCNETKLTMHNYTIRSIESK